MPSLEQIFILIQMNCKLASGQSSTLKQYGWKNGDSKTKQNYLWDCLLEIKLKSSFISPISNPKKPIPKAIRNRNIANINM